MRNLYDNLINRRKVSFHMPGHKGKMLEGINDYLENILKIDVTELSDTDDLYHANNIIAEGRNNLALFRMQNPQCILSTVQHLELLQA